MRNKSLLGALISIFFIALHSLSCLAQEVDSAKIVNLLDLRTSRFIEVKDRSIGIYDVTTPRKEVGQRLFRLNEHIAFDSLMTPTITKKILSQINDRCSRLNKDTLLTSDLIWVYQPYLDWLFAEDPHLRIEGQIPVKDVSATKHLCVPAFDVLCINDTVIINKSLDSNFHKGDRIIAINQVEMPIYLQYTYNNRYDTPANIMRYYYFSNVVADFDVLLARDNQIINVVTKGDIQSHVSLKLLQQRELTPKAYVNEKCGYLSIPCFYPNNNWLIKNIYKQIKKFKASGLTNVILDLRMNPGGNGHNFDELLSIFINKPIVKYIKGANVMASKRAAEIYNFITEQMYGRIVTLPDSEIVKEFSTNSAMYIDGMNYYILMSKDTGSVAASFCNIMQYNDAATLAGEPLLRNANKYGETIPGKMLLPTLLRASAISIVEYDEYTKATDGVLLPDIPIPYVAADYLSGKDGVLEKLLQIIKYKPAN